MKIRCIVVDDEPPAVDELVYILSKIKDVEVVASASSASKAVRAIEKLEPDLIFLDIQMPGRDGFYVAREVATYPSPPLVIFVTAYNQHAIQAFEENAIDYVLKPFSEARIQKSVARVRKMTSSPNQEATARHNIENLINRLSVTGQVVSRVTVENKGRILLLDPEDIFFFRSKTRKIMVHTQEEVFVCYGPSSLDELGNKLKFHPFFRTHRTYLANLTHIKEIIPWFNGRYLLIMSDKYSTEIPVSRSRVKELKEKLGLL